MMNSDFLPTSPPSFAALTASQELAFQHPRPVTNRVSLDGIAPTQPLEEETLVIDDRSGLSPAQMVESKLTRKLQETTLPVSHLQTRSLLRRR